LVLLTPQDISESAKLNRKDIPATQ